MMDIEKMLKSVTLTQIQNFVDTGDPKSAPQEIVEYLGQMDKIRGMYLRNGDFPTKNSIIKHLTKVDGLSYHLAIKLYNDTVEYFYCERRISKDAYRGLYADKLDQLVAFSIATMTGPKDAKAVADIIKVAMSARQLDVPDVEELPKELFDKPWKLYAMDPSFLGMPGINRNRLAEIIDNLPDTTELQKNRLKQDAAINQITIFSDDEQEDSGQQE